MNDDIERGCLLPIAQGSVAMILGFALAYGLARWRAWPDPIWIALIAGAVSALLTWGSGVIDWRRDVYTPPAPIYRTPEPAPEPDPARVRVEFTQPLDGQARQTQIADLDATTGQLRALADGLLGGAPFAESAWTGQGRPFSRGQFSSLRAEFMRRGWCGWRNPEAPTQGLVLTSQGKAVLRSFASETTGPLPYQGVDDARNL